MKFIYLIILFIAIQSTNVVAQDLDIEQEIKFEKLRRELMKAVVVNPVDSLNTKYVTYSFELRFNKELEVVFSNDTPWKVLYSKNRTASDGKNFLLKRIREFMIKENIEFEEGQIILYPVLQVWQDDLEREDNLEQAMQKIFDNEKTIPTKI